MKELGWRRMVFSLVVLAYLGLLGLFNALIFLPDWLEWLPYDIADKISAMGHFSFIDTGETHDLIHELVFAGILGTAAVGLLSQLFRPKENFAGQLIALIAWVTLILTAVLTKSFVPQPLFIIFGGLTLLATILHPAGRKLFNWFKVERVNRILFALVVVAAVPFLLFAFSNVGLQMAGSGSGFFDHNPPAFHGDTTKELQGSELKTDGVTTDEKKHIALGHYRNLAVFSLIIIFVGLLASFRPSGWRLAAWVAGSLSILLGLASLLLSNAESSLGLIWSLAAIIWGILFIATGEKVWAQEDSNL